VDSWAGYPGERSEAIYVVKQVDIPLQRKLFIALLLLI